MVNLGGIILVYSVTDKESFQQAKNLKTLLDEWLVARQLTERQVPVVLVGNKADLEPQRVVAASDGCQAAEDLNFQSFHEVSAVTGHDEIESVFADLLQCMRSAKKNECSSKKDARQSKASRSSSSSSSSSLSSNDKASTLPAHHITGSIPEIRSQEATAPSSPDGSHEINGLKRLMANLKGLSPLSSPNSSPKSSPRTSPRSSPRSSAIYTSQMSSPASLSPTPKLRDRSSTSCLAPAVVSDRRKSVPVSITCV